MKPDEFKYQRLLQKTDTIHSEPAVFLLDNDIYRHTHNDFSDLRLFNEQGQEVAFHVRYKSENDTTTTSEIVPMKLLSFSRSGTTGAKILFSRNKDTSSPDELFIKTPLHNFEKKVSVLGSNDRKNWVKLTECQPIFDYTQFIDMRSTWITFDNKMFTYYNVVIDTIADLKQSGFSRVLHQSSPDVQTRYTEFLQYQEPFRLDEITFHTLKKHLEYGALDVDQSEFVIDSTTTDTLNHSTVVYLSSNREPVNKMDITTPATNFSRQVTLFGTDDTSRNAPWKQLANGEITNILFDNFKKEHTEILLYSTCRFLSYKLVIQNKDNQPITITSVKGSGPRHEIVFFHNGITSLNVCYNADSCSVPKYDIGEILQKAPVTNGNIWKLEKTVKLHQPQSERTASFISSRNILTIVICLMVVVLAVVLFMALKKIEMK